MAISISAGNRCLIDGDSISDPALPYQCWKPTQIAADFVFRPGGQPSASRNVAGAQFPSSRGPSWASYATDGALLSTINGRIAAEVTAFQPDKIFIHAGINDIHNGVALATSQTNFTGIMDKTAGIGKPTLFVLPFYWDALDATIVTFNAAMAVIAAGYASCTCIDAYALMSASTNKVTYTTPDSVLAHYNGTGRAAFAAMVAPHITYS